MRSTIKRISKLTALSAFGLLTGLFLTSSTPVKAFSGVGKGTSNSPYLIATCQQFAEIQTNDFRDYALSTDINCSGVNLWAKDFEGTLDGRNFTISNATIRSSTINTGLFADLSGTIKNLKVTNLNVSATLGRANTGGVAGNMNGATISHVSVQGVVVGTDSVGGIAGFVSGSTIESTSFSGTVTGSGITVGGLLGEAHDSTIQDSYTNASVSGGGNIAGLIGQLVSDNSTGSIVRRTYVLGTVSAVTEQSAFIAVLAQFSTGNVTISDSFTMASTPGHTGQLSIVSSISSGTATATNLYYSGDDARYNNCGGVSCTSFNDDGSDPDRFKNTTTATPLNSWDASIIWDIDTNASPARFPLLRDQTPTGIDTLVAPDAPDQLNTSDLYPSSIGLYWNPPSVDGGSDVSSYSIGYKRSSDSVWTYIDTNTSDSFYNVAGLEPSTQYDFKVAASNGITLSVYSGEATASTTASVDHSIDSCAELNNLALDPRGSFTLGGPIDCSVTNPANENFDSGNWGSGGFVPISYFAGNLDGDGNAISGLFINHPGDYGQGLFETIGNGGFVHDFDLENVQITGRSESAGLAAYIEGSITFSNIDITGDIYSSGSTGGVFAYTESSGDISLTNVHSMVSLNRTPESSDSVYDWGGLIGYIFLDHGSLTITNSTAEIQAEENTANDVGGMIGFLDQYNNSQTTINGDTEEYSTDGSISCNNFCGGVIGKVFSNDEYGRTSLSIQDTVVSANIATSVGAGGLVAVVDGGGLDLNIDRSAYTGYFDVSVTPENAPDEFNYPGIGGLVGSDFQENGTVAISRSLVNTEAVVDTNNLGGLVGLTHSPVDISDSYFQGLLVGNGIIAGGMIADTTADFTISNSYVAGEFLGAAGGGEGGLVGIMGAGLGTITDSYVSIQVGSMGGPGAAVLGYRMDDFSELNQDSNVYVDVAAYSGNSDSPAPHCFGDQDDDDTCYYVNDFDEFGEPTEPNYFIDNNENPPLDQWNFEDTWYTSPDNHPQLFDLSWAVDGSGGGGGGNPGLGDDHTITTCEELMDAENDLAGNYVLTNDIDCTNVSSLNGGDGPDPIGTINGDFTGTLDGDGYTIRNFNQDHSDTDGGGIFLRLSEAYIHDLKIADSNIGYTGSGNTGALAASAGYGSVIDNVHSSALVTGGSNVGGLIGNVSGFDNDIAGTSITHSSVTASSVTGSGQYVGGLVGELDFATLSTSWATSPVTGTNFTGGLIGSSAALNISDVYARGDVTGGSYVGGLIGSEGASTITNAYASGNVYNADYSGGFIGVILSSVNITTIHNSFSSGTVNPAGEMGVPSSLGFIGYINGVNPDLENNYFNGFNEAVCSDRITSDETCTGVYIEASPTRFFYQTDAPMNSNWSFGGTEGPWHEAFNDYPTLNPSDLPQMECEAIDSTGTSASINCDVTPQGWGITTWEARYSVHDSTNFVPVTLTDPHTCSYTVTGLNPSQGYDLWCRFSNDAGQSEWGRGVLEPTPESGDGSVTLRSAENGSDIKLANSGCASIQTSGTAKESSLQLKDPAYAYPVGLAAFTLTGCTLGGQANITLIFTGTFTDGTALRKYNSRNNTYTTLTNANSGLVLTKTTLNGKPALQATYRITDGGAFDQDGLADGTVIDPVGLAELVVGSPNTGFARR